MTRTVGSPLTRIGRVALTDVTRGLQDEGVEVEDIGLSRPTLDDVFLRLTGHRTEDSTDARRRQWHDHGTTGNSSGADVLGVRGLLDDGPPRPLYYVRQPSTIVYNGFLIVSVLLFVYAFGSAMDIGGDYKDFAIPGMFAMTMAFGFMNTAWMIAIDKEKGVTDRFRSMPMAPSAVVSGRGCPT